MLVAFVSSKYRDLINVFISGNFNFSACIMLLHFLKLRNLCMKVKISIFAIFPFTVIILVSLKIWIIRCDAYYDIDTDVYFFGMNFMLTVKTLENILSSSFWEYPNNIKDQNDLPCNSRKQFTHQPQSTFLKAWKCQRLRERRCWWRWPYLPYY